MANRGVRTKLVESKAEDRKPLKLGREHFVTAFTDAESTGTAGEKSDRLPSAGDSACEQIDAERLLKFGG